MFLGQIPQLPNKEVALKQLKKDVTMFAVFVAIVRAAPYALHYLYAEKPELKLEI